MNNIIIRSEKVRDYFEIAEVHALAFTYSHGMGEVPLVDVHRHKNGYDPDLSIVAEIDGKVVGHVLFTRQEVMVAEKLHDCVILSPIAIHPDYQKRGIGGMLINEGHKRSVEKGYQFSLLIGDPNYYPRFGYETNMYGAANIKLNMTNIPIETNLNERRLKADDLPLLKEMWSSTFRDCDLAIYPGDSIINWISNSKDTCVSVIEEKGNLIGYIRYNSNDLATIKEFLVKDSHCLMKVASYLKKQTNLNTITIPLHPSSSFVKELPGVEYETTLSTWDAGMIRVLDEQNQAITTYVNEVKLKKREPGIVIWPVEFDVC